MMLKAMQKLYWHKKRIRLKKKISTGTFTFIPIMATILLTTYQYNK